MAFFSHPTALGCIYQAQFTPFPQKTVALVLTSIEHGIEQYTSGNFDGTMRFSKGYKDRYTAHLNALKKYEEERLWKTYWKKLLRDGLVHAGAQVEKPRAESATEVEATQAEIDADMARLAEEELDGFVDSSDIEFEPTAEEE
ncbi:hypothetical protein C2E23DRAFT_856763 [Lenzites betulinus]|nr:hypothetical protein C2E23DRAFT_856763 [Lenzites betulinus]